MLEDLLQKLARYSELVDGVTKINSLRSSLSAIAQVNNPQDARRR